MAAGTAPVLSSASAMIVAHTVVGASRGLWRGEFSSVFRRKRTDRGIPLQVRLKTENGVATADWGKAAWFLDSEGNIINISQRA